MRSELRPPALADRAIRLLIGPGAADDVIGDLREEYARFKLDELGPLRARLWYWRQAGSVLLRYGRVPRLRPARILASDVYDEQPSLGLGLAADLRLAFRKARHTPAMSFAAVATLAVGIGMTATVFAAVDGVLLEPLPYERPEDLVLVGGRFPGLGGEAITASPLEYRAFSENVASLVDLAAIWPTDANLTGAGAPRRVSAALVTPNVLSVLGVRPAVGRDFRPEDAAGSVGYVVILSNRIWQRLFRGDPSVVGRSISIDGDLVTVIGITPEEFRHPGRGELERVDVWVPMDLTEGTRFDDPGIRELLLVGRLRAEADVAGSRSEVERTADAIRRDHPELYPPGAGWSVTVRPLVEEIVGHARLTLLVLFGSVGLVLLAVVANLAVLQLARGAASARDFALRAAIGASRARIVRQLLVESLLLGVMGGVAGMGVAALGSMTLRGLLSRDFPRLENIQADGTVLGFALAVSLLSVLFFGLLPALRLSGTLPRKIFEAGGGGGPGGRGRWTRGFVRVQTAFALVLLIGAGLLLKSYVALTGVELGFEPSRVLTMQTWLPMPNDPQSGRYVLPEQRIALFEEALASMEALPEVSRSALTSLLPLRGTRGHPLLTEDAIRRGDPELQSAEFRVVSDHYFDVLGIPLLEGRSFTPDDALGAPWVAVVSRAFAERHFPGGATLGKRIRFGLGWVEIVGLVDDVRHGVLGDSAAETVYTPLRQNVATVVTMTFVLKSAGSPEAVAEAAARALQGVDPDLPAFSVASLEDVVFESRAQQRTLALLLGLFCVQSLILAGLGIYGMVSFSVTGRAREIGVRLALGGARTGVLRMLLREGLLLGAHGAAVGLLLALGLSRFLSSVLFEVRPADPAVFAAAAGFTLVLVAVAALIPALEGVRVDPARTMRAD